MDLNNLEKYEAGKKTGGIYISMGKVTASFYEDFIKRYNLQSIETVDLYYERQSNTVAFKFFENNNGGTTIIKPKNGNRYINSSGFYKAKNIDIGKFKGSYEPERLQHDTIGELFAISLKEKSKTKI